ncbi:DUF2891 domain-containing protein [Phenylobacterium sp.]|uniref:DUF2891 domain-containing protein n=1 Tax=Phenylobacterium sp. TaxID=1871053 RepID=UPI0011FC3CF8|nr:DUF2891 domain-containing protein [Phenylobacterium sp.]THD65311.1 MAG: DUF2891 domain-containing protein [Phenylobacterium sp.]
MSSPSANRLSPEIASKFAGIALGHVTREYPNKLDHVLEDPADARGPRDLHPIFFGSFDWHSCVHGYWLLATLLRREPGIPEAPTIRALFDAAFTAEKVTGEVAYLARPSSRGFERPYGWGWLLKLQAELMAHEASWAATHQPLADVFVQRFCDFLPKASYPIRTGVHSSTAFAIALAQDYAVAAGDHALTALFAGKCRAWYLADRDAPAWEPSGDEFLSATLMEAECLRRLSPPAEFAPWFAAFLPRAAERQPASLFTPATVSDRSDGKIAHLDGLNFSRAWCWRELAGALPVGDPLRSVAEATAREHLAASLPHVAGDYMGEHWLASFALLALTAGEVIG